jgi:hypothetical protein
MVTVLQRDQTSFQRPQHEDRAADDERCPQDEMYPDRRGEFDLDQSGEPDDDQAQEKNDENGWPVPRVLSGEIKTADLARIAHVQKAGK